MLKLLLIAFVGMASACTTRPRNGQSPVESGSVDIPIRLQFQQGPIPSASVSVGIESKMNQNLGNGVYKQTQFNGGFALNGAAVPVLEDGKINGVHADLDTRVSHDNRVVFLDHDPMAPTQKPVPFDPFTVAQPVKPAAQDEVRPEPGFIAAVAQPQPFVNGKRPLREKDDSEPQSKSENHVAGLKLEYFIAIMCVSGACLVAITAFMVILAKKRQRIIEQVGCNHHHHRHHHSEGSVYSSYVPEITVDQKPPSYSSDMKSEISDRDIYEKKF